MMIYNDDVGFLRSVAHACDEAGIKVGTLLAQTRLGAGIDVTPERERLRQVCEFGSISEFAFPGPVTNFFEVINFIEAIKHRRRLRASEAVKTEIVVST